jgi:hypothetical protein
MSNATWSVTGVLSDFIEDSRRAEMHITVDEGVIVMYLRLDNSSPYFLSPSTLATA